MTIEIKEKGTEAFYREVVSLTTQYRKFMKTPDMKYRDSFTSYRIMGICMILLFALELWIGSTHGFDALTIVALTVVFIAAVVVFSVDILLKKQVRKYLDDAGTSVLTLDENGVEIKKEKAQAVKLAWDNVAFVRRFNESICFFSKSNFKIILAVPLAHEKEILDYLNENSINVTVI